MSLPLGQIGDSLKTAVQAHSNVTTERLYVSEWKLGDVDGLIQTIVPRSETWSPVARKSNEVLYEYDIVFRKKLARGTDAVKTAEIDGLLETVNTVLAGIDGLAMAAGTDLAQWTGEVTREELMVREHYLEWNQFTAVVGVQYLLHLEART